MTTQAVGPRELILRLNSLSIGDLSALAVKLGSIRDSLVEIGQPDLAARLSEAGAALSEGRIQEYRRLVNQVVSRLGHLR